MTHPSLPALRGGEIRVEPRPVPAAEPSAPRSGPVILMPRRIPGGVAAMLDGLPEAALPRLRYGGPLSGLRRALRSALAERLARPRWLANWLLDDVLDKAALMAELTGAAALHLSLDAARDEPDASFAVAEAPSRLVTSYRGAGLDWIPPRAADAASGEAEPLASAWRHLPRGDVAILRGPGPDGPGVRHRAVPGAGRLRLHLTIDGAARPRRTASPWADRLGPTLQ